MERKFTPAVCLSSRDKETKQEEPSICLEGGSVTVKSLSFDERDGLYEKAGFYDGVEDEADGSKRKKSLALHRAAKAMAKDKFVSCDLVRRSDGAVFRSWEDLDFDGEVGFAVINEIAAQIISSKKSGNVSSPS